LTARQQLVEERLRRNDGFAVRGRLLDEIRNDLKVPRRAAV
jgi:hypothetical protein